MKNNPRIRFDIREGKPCSECGCVYHLVVKGISNVCEECGAMIDDKPQRMRKFRKKLENNEEN